VFSVLFPFQKAWHVPAGTGHRTCMQYLFVFATLCCIYMHVCSNPVGMNVLLSAGVANNFSTE
jgi:hypothetical protein